MERKALFFDIDGTLIDCQNNQKTLSLKTCQALHALKQKGHSIWIASGRPYCFLPQQIRDFDFDGYILSDGAHIICDDQELSYHPMPAKHIEPLLEDVLKRNLAFIGYTRMHAYAFQEDALLDYATTFMLDTTLVKKVKNIDHIKDQFVKVHIQCHNQKEYQDLKINEQHFYSANDDAFYLKEIYSRKYSKATALLEVLQHLNIPLDNSYFFGDGFNDIEMLDTVGHGIVMKNASDEVKKHGEYVCGSVLEDGVSDFIENSGIF